MHEIRYDIALLPLIILSSDLCSRKLQSVASQSKCSLKTNKTQQNKPETIFSFIFFFSCLGLSIPTFGPEFAREQRRDGRERGELGREERSQPLCEWPGLLGAQSGGCNGMRSDLEYRHCG